MAELLERQSAALEAVLEWLQQEREALLARDAAAVELAGREKEAALGTVADLEVQRRALAPDLDAMETLATQPDIGRRWERLLELTRQCREQNEANGRMIRRQQRRVAAALQLLRGASAGGQLYGPDGGADGGRPRPPLASA